MRVCYCIYLKLAVIFLNLSAFLLLYSTTVLNCTH